MGIVLRQSLKSSIGYYLGVVLGAINTLYISTQFLSLDQLATTRLLLENGLVFAAFAHLGIPNISDRFLSKYKNKEQENNGFLLFIIIMGIIGCILFSVLFFIFFKNIQSFYQIKSPSISHNLLLVLPITYIWTFITIFEAYIKGHQRIAIPTFLRETIFRLLNILLIMALGLGYVTFKTFLIGYVLIMAFILLALIYYTFHLNQFYTNFSFFKITKEEGKNMAKYGFFLILGSIGVNLILFLDRNILASEIGPQAVAVFVVGTYLASIVEIPAKSIKQISTPLLSESIINNQHEKTYELYIKVAQNAMLVGGILFVAICSNLEALLSIMPKAAIYEKGFWVIIIIGACKWFDMSLGLNAELIAFSKYYKYNTYLVLILAILAIILNYWFIPIYGLIGSALATGLITIISSSTRLGFVKTKFGYDPFNKNSLFIVLSLLFCLVIGRIIPNFADNIWTKLIIVGLKSSLVFVIFSFLILKFRLSIDFENLKNTIILKYYER